MTDKTLSRKLEKLDIDDLINDLTNSKVSVKEKTKIAVKYLRKASKENINEKEITRYLKKNESEKLAELFLDLIDAEVDINDIQDPYRKKMTQMQAKNEIIKGLERLKKEKKEVYKEYIKNEAYLVLKEAGEKKRETSGRRAKLPSKKECKMYKEEKWLRKLPKVGTTKVGTPYLLSEIKMGAQCLQVDIKGKTKKDEILLELWKYKKKIDKKRGEKASSEEEEEEETTTESSEEEEEESREESTQESIESVEEKEKRKKKERERKKKGKTEEKRGSKSRKKSEESESSDNKESGSNEQSESGSNEQSESESSESNERSESSESS